VRRMRKTIVSVSMGLVCSNERDDGAREQTRPTTHETIVFPAALHFSYPKQLLFPERDAEERLRTQP